MKTYLPRRNGIVIDAKKNTNYPSDISNKRYIRSSEANIIVDILEKMFANVASFDVLEMGACFGSLTVGLLDSPKVNTVFSIERSSYLREMLKKNLEEYGFQKNKFYIDQYPEFSSEQDYAVVINPHWEDNTNKGYQYGGVILEELINNFSSARLIIVHLPKNYEFETNKLKNFRQKKFDIGELCLFIFIPNDCSFVSHKDKLVARVDNSGNKIDENRDDSIETGGVKFKGNTEIPKKYLDEHGFIMSNFLLDNLTNEEWEKQVKVFIRNLLKDIGLCSKDISILTDDVGMGVFYAGFTHEQYMPERGLNYEELETMGDALLKTVFLEKVLNNVSGTTAKNLTELAKRVMSKAVQSKMAITLELYKYMRIPFGIDIDTLEDSIESLFGALLKVGNMDNRNMGYFLAQKMMDKIYDFFEFSFETLRMDPKTEVQQMLKRLQWSNIIEQPKKIADGEVEITLYLPADALRALKEWSGHSYKAFLGKAVSSKKRYDAEPMAYREALRKLESYGINEEFVAKKVEQRIFGTPEYKALRSQVLKYLKKDKIIDLKYSSKRQSHVAYIFVRGERTDGKIIFLHKYVDTEKKLNSPITYINALEDYIKVLEKDKK